MKTNIIYLIIISLLIIGCEGSKVRFYEAQPSKVKSLKKFPIEYQGKFNTVDSIVLVYFDHDHNVGNDSLAQDSIINTIEITEDTIFNHINGILSFDLKSVEDSTEIEKFNDSTMINDFRSEIDRAFHHVDYTLNIVSTEDSVYVFKLNLLDTLFHLSEKGVIKKYKENLYLSVEGSENYWNVFQLHLDENDILYIKPVHDEDEILLKGILKMNSDSIIENSYKPSKKSFKMFLKMGGFYTKFELKRTNANNSK